MQTILGFLFDFKSNAGKTFKKVRTEIVKSTKEWGKSFKGLSDMIGKSSKMTNLYFKQMSGNLRLFAAEMKAQAPSITDIITDIGNNFGGLAGIIADTLLRPGALLAGGVAVAAQTATKFNDTMVETYRETAMTTEQLQKYGSVLKQISLEMRAPLNQVESLGKRFASANISLDDFNDLMVTAISMNRLTGEETSMFSGEMMKMRNQLKLGSKDMRDYYNSLYGAAQATEADIGTLVGTTDMLVDLVGRTLPKELRRTGMISGIELAAGISAALGDEAPGVISELYSAMIDVSNPKRQQLLVAVSALGNDAVKQFEDAVKKGDIYSAFDVLKKGIGKIDAAGFLQIKTALQETFGFSVDILQKIQGIDDAFYAAGRSSSEVARSTDKIAKDGKTALTQAQRWHKLWGDIERILLPIGEVVMDVVNSLISLIEPLLKMLSSFMTSLGPIGKMIVTIGIGLATAHMWIGLLKGVAMQVASIMATTLATTLKLPIAITNSTKAMQGMAVASTQANAATGGLWSTMMGGIKGAGKGIAGLVRGASLLALPFIKIIALFMIIDSSLKKITKGNFGLFDALNKAVEFLAWIVDKIAAGVGFIAAAVHSLATLSLDPIRDFQKNVNKDWNAEYDRKHNPTQVGSYAPVSMPYESTNLEVSPTVTSEVFASQEKRDARKEIGTDDIIAATYESADMIVKAILAGNVANKSLAPGPVGNPTRHKSVPEPTHIGSPR